MEETFLQWQQEFMDPERIPHALVAILIAGLIGMITGPLAGNANPFIWIVYDKGFGWLGERLDRKNRPAADLMFRGFMVMAFALFTALLLGRFYQQVSMDYNVFGMVEALLLSTLISVGAPGYVLLRLYFLQEKKTRGKGTYYALSRSTRTNLTASDDYGVNRVAMSFFPRVFDKGLVGPVFWYLVGGLPWAVVYSVLAALAWRFGKNGFTKGFGQAPLVLERLPGFVVSLFSAALIAGAGLFTPGSSLSKGLSALAGMKDRAPYEQGGFPLSVLAWLLNVSLGGATQDLSGSAIKGVWTGPKGASAQADHQHLRRVLFIGLMAHLLFLAALCGAYLWSGSLG